MEFMSRFDENPGIPKPAAATDPYTSWTENERMEEWMETGNPEYLTPAMARNWAPPEVMREVLGATPEDIALSIEREKVSSGAEKAKEEELRDSHGIGAEELKSLNQIEGIQRLFDVNALRRVARDDEELEQVKEIAFGDLYQATLRTQEQVFRLFDAIRYESSKGLRDLAVVERVYRQAYADFVRLSHTFAEELSDEERELGQNTAQVLNEFVAVSSGVLQGEEFLSQSNYLFIQKLRDFAYRIGITETAQHEFEYIPFEISKGQYATFTEDGDRLYVADPDLSKGIASELETFDGPTLHEQGQYFARHTVADVPEEVLDLHWQILDAGTQIDEMNIGLLEEDPELLRDYVTTLKSGVRTVIEDDFSVELKELSIREQLYFISFLKEVQVVDATTLQEFTSNYGALGVQAFLSLEQLGREQGWVIASGANLVAGTPLQATVEKIFQSFVDLDHLSLEAEDYLIRNFNSHEKEAVHEVMLGIRNRAADLLREFGSKPLDDSATQAALAEMSQDALLFVTAFKTLKVRGELELSEIQDTSFESAFPEQISESDKSRMLEILALNWKHESPEFVASIRDSFEAGLQNKKSTFYILRHQGMVVAFNRFDDNSDTENPSIYFGSLNSDPSYGNGKLGEAVYEESLKQQIEKGVPIDAHCNPLSPITQRYIETGFVATKLEDYAGVPSFSIRLDSKINELSKTKNWKVEHIIQAALNQNNDVVQAFSVRKVEEVPFDLVNQGYALTRYLKQGERIYAVFERLSPAEKGSA